jgi:ABC-2 type transport system permease protein
MTAIVALTERVVVNTFRDLDLPFAILTPVSAFIGFNLIMRNLIETGDMSYPQYVLPITVIQAAVFSSITTADRAARDEASGFGKRLYTQPISTATPLLARMLYCLIRTILGLLATLAVGYAFGFRFTGAPWQTALFIAIAIVFPMALSFGSDAVGSRLSHIEAPSQLLLLPQMLLVLLSTGLAPADAFPESVQPFVRDQPVSQVADAMRALSVGHAPAGLLISATAWSFGLLLLFGCYAVHVQRRTE